MVEIMTLSEQKLYVHEFFLKRKLLESGSNPAQIPATQGVVSESLTSSSNPTERLAANQGGVAKVLQKIVSAKSN